FAGWRLFFERMAVVAPVILLVEDAQNADVDLLGFLDHLIDWTRELPVFVLVFSRPELQEQRAGFGVGRNRSTLSLDPLDHSSMESLIDALLPGMPEAARAAVTARAQGIPLFAVETVRSLIDSGSVIESGGAYRLAGDLGELAVPDSLHALLASRLDALDPPTRSLVGFAAVLGSSFPAEALVSVSGREPGEVAAGVAELVRRNVLEVAADPLSPQIGDYRFAQEMLRQVAYETLSRRERRARHLAVASYLRDTFANDGEEIAEVIARHYTDALDAGPEEPDSATIREEALSMLVRAAERAERAGAPSQAAACYSEAAQLAADRAAGVPGSDVGAGGGALRAAQLFERGARAAVTAGDEDRAQVGAEAARIAYGAGGEVRGAARARAIGAEALLTAGRLSEARTALSEALEVLRPEPDGDTVLALGHLARVEIFAGSPEADRLASEALVMGQEIGVDEGLLAKLLNTRGVALAFANRTAEAVSFMREAVRLAEIAGDASEASRALLNLSSTIRASDPAGAREAAATSAEKARRVGNARYLESATGNLVFALLDLGEWDEARRVASSDGEWTGRDAFGWECRAFLAALEGRPEAARALLDHAPPSEDRQGTANFGLARGQTQASLGNPKEALGHAMDAVRQAPAVWIGHEAVCWAWPLAARLARHLGDSEATAELLSVLGAHRPGHLPPLLRAERLLALALAATEAGSVATAAGPLAAAVEALRAVGSPYHLAHGLLDQAAFLAQAGDSSAAEAARAAVDEARAIGERLGCRPLVEGAGSVKFEPAPAT
ncbi:MAG: ATP-binding protein, partial [Acidimicrobiales bacterium]